MGYILVYLCFVSLICEEAPEAAKILNEFSCSHSSDRSSVLKSDSVFTHTSSLQIILLD